MFNYIDRWMHRLGKQIISTPFTDRKKQVKTQFTQAQVKYKTNYDAHHQKALIFIAGDMVWSSRRHITTSRPSSKLDFKRLGPFKVLSAIGDSKLAYKLELECASTQCSTCRSWNLINEIRVGAVQAKCRADRLDRHET
jgi:hypothetical protein